MEEIGNEGSPVRDCGSLMTMHARGRNILPPESGEPTGSRLHAARLAQNGLVHLGCLAHAGSSGQTRSAFPEHCR